MGALRQYENRNVKCVCGGRVNKAGFTSYGSQKYVCVDCRKQFVNELMPPKPRKPGTGIWRKRR